MVTRERLLEMMTAYKSTYLLRAAVELGVFDSLNDQPANPDVVAKSIGADPRATRILLNALAGTGLLLVDGDEFRLAEGTERLLVSTSPEYFGGNTHVAASDWEWDTMRHLGDIVRTGEPIADAEAPGFPFWVDFATNLTGVTKAGAGFVAEILQPTSPRILDVGCGHGLFGFTVAAKHPEARVSCLDWPDVLDVARQWAGRMGVLDRAEFIPGDAFTVDLDGPYDVIIVANLLLQFSHDRGVELLRRLVSVLKPGGRVVIVGFTSGDAPPEQEHHARMLALLMLASTAGGELYSSDDYCAMLTSAGLEDVRSHRRDGLPLRVIVGELP
jgi:SAM-dependent methyltransferase